jgi:hypothetical protein
MWSCNGYIILLIVKVSFYTCMLPLPPHTLSCLNKTSTYHYSIFNHLLRFISDLIMQFLFILNSIHFNYLKTFTDGKNWASFWSAILKIHINSKEKYIRTISFTAKVLLRNNVEIKISNSWQLYSPHRIQIGRGLHNIE